MKNYKKLLFLEEKEFSRVDFTIVNRPCSFNNICEQVMYQERNHLERVKNIGLPFSKLTLEFARYSCREGDYMNASQMFEKAVLWNPAGVSAHLEYMAFLLYMKDFEGFERVARESFRYVYQNPLINFKR